MTESSGGRTDVYQLVAQNKSKLLVVDAHLDLAVVNSDGGTVPSEQLTNPLPVTHDGSIAIAGEVRYHKRLKRCKYRVGNWQVFVPWPWMWKCPGPNRLGWLPSAEFGDPTFHGETAHREVYPLTKPFSYVDCDGQLYTPAEDFQLQ